MIKKHLLVLGAGSVGKRHLYNFSSLGCEVSIMDPRSDRVEEAAKIVSPVHRFANMQDAIAHSSEFSGLVVCSPPKFHVDQAIAFLERDVPVLLEKPVSPDLSSALLLKEAVQKTNVPLLLGYTYRWWPPLIEMKKRILDIGAIRHARFMMSAHLADWHPWERYQDFFMASRELGGGALLDESHFIDLMIWFFGMPKTISGRVERLSHLEIETDDNVDLLCAYENNLRVTIHLDLYGRPHEKSITSVGEKGTLQCLFDPNSLRHAQDATGKWDVTPFSCDRNDMFVAEAKEFLEIIENRIQPSSTIADGIDVLRCIEAARQSTSQERAIRLSEVGRREEC